MKSFIKITQALAANGSQAAHDVALATAVGVEAVTASSMPLGAAVHMGAVVGQMMPGVALTMGVCQLALSVTDFVASYEFDRLSVPAQKSSERKDEMSLVDKTAMRNYAVYAALRSLPVIGFSLMPMFPDLIPTVLTGFSAYSLVCMGMAMSSCMNLIAQLNQLAHTDSLSGPRLMSLIFTTMETTGWTLCAVGNPVLGFTFLAAATFFQAAWRGTLVKDVSADCKMAASKAKTFFDSCFKSESRSGSSWVLDESAQPTSTYTLRSHR